MHWDLLSTELAPPGANSIRLCQYSGMNSKPRYSLIAEALITSPGTVSMMVRYLSALPKQASGTYSCGTVDGAETIAYLRYRNHGSVGISLETGGCDDASNGHYSLSEFGPYAVKLDEMMAQLVKPVH